MKERKIKENKKKVYAISMYTHLLFFFISTVSKTIIVECSIGKGKQEQRNKKKKKAKEFFD